MAAAKLLNSTAQSREQVAQGRLPVRLEGLCDDEDINLELSAPLCLSSAQVKGLRTGVTLGVEHFDNDLDRPVIRSIQTERKADAARCLGPDWLLAEEAVHLQAPQTLHLSSGRDLQIGIGRNRFEITTGRISLLGMPPALIAKHSPGRQAAPAPLSAQLLFGTDLRLTSQPDLQGTPLANQIWYIVNMREPGLEFLARAHPQDILFEGKTDPLGYLGLGPNQLRELAEAYRDAPDTLCLVHPGQCIRLKTWFRQNWSNGMLQAFMNHY